MRIDTYDNGKLISSEEVPDDRPAEQIEAEAKQQAYQAWFDAQDFDKLQEQSKRAAAVEQALIDAKLLTKDDVDSAVAAVQAAPAPVDPAPIKGKTP